MKNLDFLNDKQREAVLCTEGPLLIIAGPGSGKTKTMVERVSYLLNEKNIKPKEILLATFTKKATRELITRVSENLNSDININEMYIGTIHAILERIINENIEKSFLKKGFEVLDEPAQKLLIYKNLKEFEKIEGAEGFFNGMFAFNRWKKAGELRIWIDRINEEILCNPNIEKSKDDKIKFLKKANEKYKALLFKENNVDFSNLQSECLRIFLENPDVLEKIQENIKYIMIDEYQDTNSIQEKIILLMGAKRKNICVVGDDDQGLYRFRGATVKNILHFQQNFEVNECKKIELSINYRSNEDIVNFCNLWNEGLNWDGWRYPKHMVSGKKRLNKTLGVIKISEFSREKWLNKICRFILYLKNTRKITDYNQVAFLFGSVKFGLVLDLMKYLEENGIPVYSPRSNLFFYRDEIKFAIGLLIMAFPKAKDIILKKDEEKNYDVSMKIYYNNCYTLTKNIIRNDKPLIDYISSIREKFLDENLKIKAESFIEIFYGLLFSGTESTKKYFDLNENHILKNRSTYNLAIFAKLLNNFDNICGASNINEDNIDRLVKYFFNIHLKFLIDDGMVEYESMKEYAPMGAVSFLTVHQAKGLEFPCVIVGSLDKVPKPDGNETKIALDGIISENFEPEYRIKEFDFWRLYYTAFSRAQNLLALTCIESRSKVPSPPFKRVYENLSDAVSDDFCIPNLHFEEIKKINLKDLFSFTSHISQYESCPRLYKFSKKYEFISTKNMGMAFGSLVHESLEEINKKLLKNEEVSSEIISKIFYENYEITKKKNRLFINDNILSDGEKSIKDYFYNKSSLYDSIKEVEVPLSLVKEKYILEGVIDLVTEKNGEIEIIDFKTGKRGEREKVYINQLEIYAYLLEKQYKREIKKGKLYYLDENKIIEINFTKERLDKAIKNFDEIATKIQEENYDFIFDEEKKVCSTCILKNYCKSEKK